MTEPLFPLDAFQLPPGICHACVAGESAPLYCHQQAFSQYAKDKSEGLQGRVEQNNRLHEARVLVSESWNVALGDIGFVSSVAEGVSLVLESLKWEKGDNVCLDADEFPSLVAPFAIRAQQNQHNRLAGDDGAESPTPEMRFTKPETLATDITSNTRLIAVSYVSYLNSSRIDLSHYRRLADSVGAILLVDFTQAAGYAPIDASQADFAFSACYKWLLGTTGAAIACWNRTRQPDWKPSTAGWHSLSIGEARPSWGTDGIKVRDDAMCFCRGNPAHLSIYILLQGLRFLRQWEPVKIQSHIQTLTSELLRRLTAEGIMSSTPPDNERHGASVTIDCEGASEIVDKLDHERVSNALEGT
ncbi:pyridoxal phosphate-dependent transferase [Xylaria sp. FL1777]|nr:pyridoxal phosphate-dependent transferase [Xylaria sp. FL1777]